MTDALESLARRLQGDPFFLASALADYAHSEGLDEAGLAAALNCPVERLTDLRLCRLPAEDPAGFRRDVERIASHFGLCAGALTRVVRRGQALQRLRTSSTGARGTLLAAREPPPDPSHE